MLLPTNTASKLFSTWTGPAKILKKRSPYSYDVEMSDGSKRCFHANHLRKFHVRVESVLYDSSVYDVSNCDACNFDGIDVKSCSVMFEDDEDFGYINPVPERVDNPSCYILPSTVIDPSAIEHLNTDQQRALLTLLDEFSDCFSEIPGFTSVVTHSIPLTDDFKPKRLPAYRVPERLKTEVSKQIHEMLENQIIRPSNSPMSSPLVCILKGRDGSAGVRLAVDYRYVNKFTRDDAFPMPYLQSIYQSVSKSNVISVIDCKSAYWQLGCNADDVWKTAFVCDDGQYEFLRCPFGLKNSGTSFVRAMQKIISPIKEVAKSFVDDVAVHSNDWSDHLLDLRKFLEVIKRAGLTLNLKKCKWGHSQVRFCGKIVGSGKISADPEKLEVLDQMETPKTKKELRRILGFFGYFRESIPNFAGIAKPLTDLTSKRFRTQIPWSEIHQEAFCNLKEALKKAVDEPLHSVDFTKPLSLFTDANECSVAAALTQLNDNGNYLPVAFSSTKLNETQRKWSVVEKESFAVLTASRRYNDWIIGSSVTVYVDHNPLTYLTETMPKSPKLIRWALSLQQFNVTFKYYPGHKNVVADCLSRI